MRPSHYRYVIKWSNLVESESPGHWVSRPVLRANWLPSEKKKIIPLPVIDDAIRDTGRLLEEMDEHK